MNIQKLFQKYKFIFKLYFYRFNKIILYYISIYESKRNIFRINISKFIRFK